MTGQRAIVSITFSAEHALLEVLAYHGGEFKAVLSGIWTSSKMTAKSWCSSCHNASCAERAFTKF